MTMPPGKPGPDHDRDAALQPGPVPADGAHLAALPRRCIPAARPVGWSAEMGSGGHGDPGQGQGRTGPAIGGQLRPQLEEQSGTASQGIAINRISVRLPAERNVMVNDNETAARHRQLLMASRSRRQVAHVGLRFTGMNERPGMGAFPSLERPCALGTSRTFSVTW